MEKGVTVRVFVDFDAAHATVCESQKDMVATVYFF